jgi:hypothetical protein
LQIARQLAGEEAVKSKITTSPLLVLIAVFTVQAAHAQTRPQATVVEPYYLVFQMGTENKDFATVLPELKAEFGAKPAGSSRYVGFGVALMTLKTPVEELRRQVTRALNSAEETGLPVLIKLDDMNFTAEYTDPSMVEWTAFPKPGETHGPLAKHYWLNWGSWMALPPTPNFESAAFRQDVEMRLKEGVLPPLMERLARWKDQNRSYLFAGVCVGWESGIPEYRPLRQAAVMPRDEQRKITMTEEERGVQFGYASLYARGWTQQKIQETAAKTGKSVEDMTTELLFQVIHDYTSFWAKTVHDAGIPKERIYTHGVAWESVPDERLPGTWMRKSSRVPPIWVNVNAYSRPGYTAGAGQFDSEGLVKLLRAAGAADGWSAVEAYVRGVESEEAFGGYLGQLFASGARMVDIFGWTAAGSPYDPKRAPGALLAMHAWLEGKERPQASAQTTQPQATPSAGVPQSLQQKMQQLQALVEKRQQAGANLQPVGEMMQGFEPLIQQQKFSEAEALLDRALKLAGELSPSAGQTTPKQSSPPLQPQELHLQNQIWGSLRAAIVDQETGRGVKARCYLTDSADQSWSPSGAITYVKPLERHFIASGEFQIALPPGTYILRVERGTEYLPVIRRIEIRPGDTHDEKVELARWINMNARGWYSGDLHNHRDWQEMSALLLAEDLNLAPTLTNWVFVYHTMPTTQPPATAAQAVRRVDATHAYSIFDTEIEGLGPASGSVDLLALRSPLGLSNDRLGPLNTVYTELAHRQGAYVDAEKITWRDSAALIALDQVDFAGLVYNSFTPHGVEVGWGVNPIEKPEYATPMGAPLWAMDLYYKFLNCGFKLPVSAGTASGVKPVPLGYDRVYVKLSEGFSYEAWFRALKAGRSFATNGPMLFLTVNGHAPGNSIVLPATTEKSPGHLKVHAEVISIGDLERLEIIWKGRVVKTVEASDKTQTLSTDLEVDAQSSGWFAARAFEKSTETVRFAHTSPVYVRVGRDDGLVADDAKYLLALIERQIKYCETSSGFRNDADRQTMLAFFRKAEAVYARLATANKQE